MSEKSSPTESDGFTAAERAAMKQRAAELRAEGKQGAKKADGLQAPCLPSARSSAARCFIAARSAAVKPSDSVWELFSDIAPSVSAFIGPGGTGQLNEG